jgi:hypothetical protein
MICDGARRPGSQPSYRPQPGLSCLMRRQCPVIFYCSLRFSHLPPPQSLFLSVLSHLCSQSYRSSPTSVLIFFSPRLSKFSFFINPLPAHSSVLIVIPHLRTLFSPVPSQSSILSVLSHLRIHSDRSSSTTVFLVFVFSSLILPSVFQFSHHFRGTLFNLNPRSCQSLVTSVLVHLSPWSSQYLVISVLGHLSP